MLEARRDIIIGFLALRHWYIILERTTPRQVTSS